MGCVEALATPRNTTPSGLPIILVSAACLVDKQGRILLAQRPEGKAMAGLWEFPAARLMRAKVQNLLYVVSLKKSLVLMCVNAVCFLLRLLLTLMMIFIY